MPTYIRTVAALGPAHDAPFAAEPRLVKLRSQVAVVRALADQVERVTRAEDVDALGTQIVGELGRLGSRLHDAAAALAELSPVERVGS